MSGHLGAAPYMPEPARAPRASWWRNVRRLARLGFRPWTFGPAALLAAAACVPLRVAIGWQEYDWRVLLLNWAAFATFVLVIAMGRSCLRLRRVRRAMRPKPNATATTFPAIAAYRELARTGDVEAFAAKGLRPVTVEYTLQAMDYAEAARALVITPPDAAIKATVIVLADDERRGLTTNLDELGAVK